MNVRVYKCRREATYLYVGEATPLDELPSGLQALVRDPEPFLEFDLAEKEKLGTASIDAVRAAVAEQGFFLQLPPTESIPESIEAAHTQETASASEGG